MNKSYWIILTLNQKTKIDID